MKTKLITIFALLSLLVGCTTTHQTHGIEAEYKKSNSEQAEGIDTLTLRATGTVYVLVKTKSSNEQIYRDTLNDGESVTLEIDEPVDVLFTAGKHLLLEWEGKEISPSSAGAAKITLK